MTNLKKVCLAIATFQNDDCVIDLLDKVIDDGAHPFHQILVLDSLGTGKVRRWIDDRGVDRIAYHNASQNLGSAGNLARRLTLGAVCGADYVYTINHDGEIDLDLIERLVAHADGHERVGAVYPLHFYVNRNAYDQTGTSPLPLPFIGSEEAPTTAITEVQWSSSNGALYATAPVRRGLVPDENLWMGWEDMGYGWELSHHGYKQLLVNDAIFEDDYEYKRYDLLGKAVYVTEKPAWYTYYQIRNLFLIADKNKRSAATYATIASRVLLELGVTTAFRPKKLTRLSYMAAGLADGLRNRAGKWKVP